MSELEKDIENNVVKWAQKHGFLTPKVKFAEDGWPDRLFISPSGHTIFIEFKRRGEVPTKLQEYRISELHRRGIPATWHDTFIGAVTTLKAALEPSSVSAESDQAAPIARIGGPVPRPGTGQDVSVPSGIQNLKGEGIRQKDVDSGPSKTGLQGLAGRDPEVD